MYNTKIPLSQRLVCFFLERGWSGEASGSCSTVVNTKEWPLTPVCSKHLPNNHYLVRGMQCVLSSLSFNCVLLITPNICLATKASTTVSSIGMLYVLHSVHDSLLTQNFSPGTTDDIHFGHLSGGIILRKCISHRNHSPLIFHTKWNCSLSWIASYHRWNPSIVLYATLTDHAVRNDHIWVNRPRSRNCPCEQRSASSYLS